VPLDWAMTQVELGTALMSLGQREAGTARLEEAVRAFQEALQVRQCELAQSAIRPPMLTGIMQRFVLP